MRFAAIESWKRYHFQLRGHGKKPVYSNLQHAKSPLRRYAIDWTATILRSSAKTINKKPQRSAGFHYNSSFGVHFVAVLESIRSWTLPTMTDWQSFLLGSASMPH